jgi:hypothetical protein
MILALGARGREFDSRNAPVLFLFSSAESEVSSYALFESLIRLTRVYTRGDVSLPGVFVCLFCFSFSNIVI